MKHPTLLLLAVGWCCLNAPLPTSAGDLPRSLPEKQGVSSSAILDFVTAADKQIESLHSFMLVRHGQVVAEGWWAPYAAESRHTMYSLSKSFTSTAVGLAIAEGKMSLDDTVISHFPQLAPAEPSANLKAMRVRDLLAMSTGHHNDDLGKFSFTSNESLPRQFLALPVAHKPGTHFVYNTPATYMLSAIVQKVTGTPVNDYLRPRLYEPLGIENPVWDTDAEGISLGGYGLHIRTGDIARFGQLYLQKGKWNGRQLIPATWIEAATTRQTSNGSNPESDWDQGYGYQFWRCRHGFYRGDGAFGQYCVVMPEQDAVLAITGGVRDMQAVLNLVWQKLVPGLQAKPLPANREAQAKLKSALAGLKLPVQTGTGSVSNALPFTGRKYVFAENEQGIESVRLENASPDGGTTLVARIKGVERRLEVGGGAWLQGRLAFADFPEQPAALSGAWTSDGAYTAKICLNETPFVLTWEFQFAKDQLVLETRRNVGFGTVKQPRLTGRAE